MASDYPVILSIENHCRKYPHLMQRMATTFKLVFGEKLLTTPLDDYPVRERERGMEGEIRGKREGIGRERERERERGRERERDEGEKQHITLSNHYRQLHLSLTACRGGTPSSPRTTQKEDPHQGQEGSRRSRGSVNNESGWRLRDAPARHTSSLSTRRDGD